LDVNLGEEIEVLDHLGIKIAVITNASLLWLKDVRDGILDADWVSLKVDAVNEGIWRRVDRPHGSLELEKVLEGIKDFAEIFNGELTTETMLIKDVNDGEEEVREVARFLESLNPDEAYVAIPTRPPAEEWAVPADEGSINRAYQIFDKKLSKVEYLIGYEGNAFAGFGTKFLRVHKFRVLTYANTENSPIQSNNVPKPYR